MKTLLVFGEDWGRHPSSTQHLMPYIADGWNVVWINSIGLRRPTFKMNDVKRAWQKLLARFGKSSQTKANNPAPFPVLNPMVIPLPRNRVERWINRALLKRQVKPYLAFGDEVYVWASLPSAIDYKNLFHEKKWVYYCGDDFNGLAGVDHAWVTMQEQELITQASCIWVASEKLKKKISHPRVQLIEHGVDVTLFSSSTAPAFERKRPQPVLGFYGALADWIDQTLLIDIATQLPDWEIMLVGPTLVDVSRLEAIPNITLKPVVPHHCLPGYIQHWDAAILPFVDNDQIHACNPLKLREYLASGTPVISTDFPALQPYREVVHVVKKASDVCDILVNLPVSESQTKKQSRINRVADESWARRAEEILMTLKTV